MTNHIMVFETPDDFNAVPVELSEYWKTIDKLEEACSREFIHGYQDNHTMEACIDLKDHDYTLWVLGNVAQECHL